MVGSPRKFDSGFSDNRMAAPLASSVVGEEVVEEHESLIFTETSQGFRLPFCPDAGFAL